MIWIDNAKVITTYLVVLVHVANQLFYAPNSVPLGFDWWVGNIFSSGLRHCPCLFVMLSGYLLLNPEKSEPTSVFYKKRSSRILIPLIFWSFFYSVLTIVQGKYSGQDVAISSLLLNLLYGMPYYHMWFFYMIAGLYFFTPFLRRILPTLTKYELRNLTVVMFILAAITQLFNCLLEVPLPYFFVLFLFFIPYYFLGWYLGNIDSRLSIGKLILMLLAILSFTATGLAVTTTIYNMNMALYFYEPFSPNVILLTMVWFFILKKINIPTLPINLLKNLSRHSMGIFIMHPFLISVISFFGIKTFIFNPILTVPLIALAVFCLGALATQLISMIPVARRII